MERLKANLPARRKTIQKFIHDGASKLPRKISVLPQIKKLANIQRLKQEMAQKEAIFYNTSLDENSKKNLSIEIMELNDRIDELEWEIMPSDEKEKIKRIAEKMRKKFEVSEGIISQQEQSSE